MSWRAGEVREQFLLDVGLNTIRKELTLAECVPCLQCFSYSVSFISNNHVGQLFLIHTLCIKLKLKRIHV